MPVPALTVAALGVAAALGILEVVILERAGLPRPTTRPRPLPERDRCPYCHAIFEADEPVRRCRGCGTRHHEDCWKELGLCSVYACATKELVA